MIMADDLMKKSLAGCYSKINNLVKKTRNQILILDYTYCILEREKLVDIKSYYFNCVPNYGDLLSEFINTKGNSIGLKKGLSIVTSYETSVNKTTPSKKVVFNIYDSKGKKNFNVTSIESWHKFCAKKGLGGFMMTIFYRVSPNHMIGIYLILTKPVKNKILILEITDIIKDYLMTEGWSITYEIVSKPVLKSLLQTDIGVEKAVDLELINLRIYKNEVDHNAHTIFNILPDSLLGVDKIKTAIKKEFSEQSPLYEIIEYEQKRLELTNIIFQIISQKEIEEFKGKTISDFLLMLKEYEPTKKAMLKLNNIGTVDFVPDRNNHYNGNANKTFMVLWNFWHNASQYSVENFHVNAFEKDGKLCISFVNWGDTMHQDNCLFLLNRKDTPVSVRGVTGGLYIAREALKELNWEVINATTNEDKSTGIWENRIDLIIQKHRP